MTFATAVKNSENLNPMEAETVSSASVELPPSCRNITVYQETIQAEFLTLHAETELLLRKLQSLSNRSEQPLETR